MKLLNLIKRIRSLFMSNEDYLRGMGVKIGKGCSISSREFPTEGYLVEVGDYVRIAQHVSIYTHGTIVPLRILKNDPDVDQFGKVKIGDYSFIGAYAMIMPGVTIGRACIVAGGAVVTKSVPDGWMVAGNPAKFIGYTDDYYNKIKEKYDMKSKRMSDDEKKTFLLSQPEEKFVRKCLMKLPN